MKINANIFYFTCLLSLLFYSCDKVDVTFTDNASVNDPNVTYHEEYKVDVATLKLDSFATSGNSIFMLGTHFDSAFGKISSNSYAEIQLPSPNVLLNKDVVFDSLQLVLTPNGNYYGDTNAICKLSVHELEENIENNTGNTNFYYPATFAYSQVSLGQTAVRIQPNKKKEITIRLSDELGEEWLSKLKDNAAEIQSQVTFRRYFKGICITTDSLSNNTMYYFTGADTTTIMRLYYKEKGVTTVEKTLLFTYPAATQFNNIRYNFTGTPFASFLPYKQQVNSSAIMANRVYISNNIPCYAKISFPDLLSLKELNPYIKIIRAELEITPAHGTYNYPNKLPQALQIYVGNSDNTINGYLTDAGGAAQNGNLIVDDLYGVNTKYSFDVTGFVNTVFNEGRFSTRTILLEPASTLNYNETSRLIFNDQSKNGIKLKLYVLGL